MEYNKGHRGDLYPTHGLGPVCQAMNIHRGDKMNFLVSVDTKPIGNPQFLKDNRREDANGFRNGDHTSTLIGTEKGKSILIEHNVTSPRPSLIPLTEKSLDNNSAPVEIPDFTRGAWNKIDGLKFAL